ncbi:Acyl dehydratase [Collimonas sp. OK607]|uniref:MaoC/PaaZ C-terminal domain-containing protein n=1 Tax=Collimonas sp. OK607 TaxID=1798194 RepID=UPI0008EC11E5|nr:MaoC/PaaZ C-terminal domain-containing protein [Collimonas sp. OK607]SFA82824.1 Acyl dehydratase [Collimonas sp. OK607]
MTTSIRYWEDMELGKMEESAETFTLTAQAIKEFAGQWDPFPPHIDEAVAARTPIGQLFAAGVHLLSIIIRLSHTIPHEETSSIAARGWDQVRFHRPAVVGDILRAQVTHLERKEDHRPERGVIVTRFELRNQHDQVVLSFFNNVVMLRRPVVPA